MAGKMECLECGRPLRPIGEYVKRPKHPNKLFCPWCRKPYWPYQVGATNDDVRKEAGNG